MEKVPPYLCKKANANVEIIRHEEDRMIYCDKLGESKKYLKGETINMREN